MSQQLFQWLTDNWLKIAIPLLFFLATYVIGLWLRKRIDNVFARWTALAKWEGYQSVKATARRSFLFWFLLLGITIAVQVSDLPPQAKRMTGMIAVSLFVLSLGWLIIILSEQTLKIYLPKMKAPQKATAWAINIVRIALIMVGALIVLEIWGMPSTPLLLLIAVAVLAATLALRNAAPSFFAGMQLAAGQQVKVGDYIKLESGEEGYVVEINLGNIRLEGLGESTIIVPNSRFVQQTVVNYGRPLKKAKEPFRFYSRAHLTELTGLRAKNLRGLVDILRKAPEAVIYFHTHHFLEQYHYLTPEPSNDVAVWVRDALGDEVLGERLASIDTFDFPNLGSLRERLVGIIGEHISDGPALRDASEGREFHFMKSVSVILPSPYVVHDLREFAETLHKISLGSLYFHIFESRLRLSRGLNDFSIWIQDSLGETELAGEIARLDPYTYTLEGLRSTLIQLIEKRIK